jgi:hypothetical protein
VWTYTHLLKTKGIPTGMGLKQSDGEITCSDWSKLVTG